MRGEQIDIGVNGIHATGSPPLARGTGDICGVCWPPAWITPACAGNRQCDNLLHTCGWDHPRLRGEQLPSVRHGAGDKGSPPLARGTVYAAAPKIPLAGITPACAGNRTLTSAPADTTGDHPRLRGEQPVKSLFGAQGGDHPRLRGEQDIQRSKIGGWQGSPPLARGTGYNEVGAKPAYRITPACAGNRATQQEILFGQQDHPRLRGEQGAPSVPSVSAVGSPPLARGTGYPRLRRDDA